jgi:hypothetical protein
VIGVLVAILVAALAYLLVVALTGSGVLALVAAVLVLLAGIGYPAYGRRF